MKARHNRTGRALRKRAVCHANRPSSLGVLAGLLSQRSALLDYIRKNDGVQDATLGEIADMKFELQHVQAQIDAVNNGEEISLEAAAVAGTIEANVGQLARKAITAEDPEDVIVTCGQAVSGTSIGCWAVATAPYKSEGKKRLQVSFAFALPHTPPSDAPAEAALIWGVAEDGNSAWHEPPPGWSTEPPISWDIAHGAWGTHSTVLGSVPVEGGTVPAFGVVVEVPWKSNIRKYNGLAFKWSVKVGSEKLWFGDASGGNLSVRTSFAKFVLSSTDSDQTSEDSDPEEGNGAGMNTSDKEDPSGAANLLAGLKRGQLTALRATRSESPHATPQVYATSIECAMNPWSDASSGHSAHTHVAHDFVHGLGSDEQNAQRSLMHRYDIALQYVQRIQWPSGNEVQQVVDGQALSSLSQGPSGASDAPQELHGLLAHAASAEGQLMAVAVWLRFAAARLLVWNHNYNIKPREISTSQDQVSNAVADIWKNCPWARKTVVMVLATVGRGGDGNQGQRIRDEILSIQSRNGCKGGMMEQWHQKLHNNTSPDDVEICKALIAYLESGLDIQQYWDTLHAAGINEQRLASFDRSITHEPSFSKQQIPQLVKDLQAYLVTLSAVHGGLDLQSGALPVLGYQQVKRKGRSVNVEAVEGFNTKRLKKLVQSLLALQQRTASDKSTVTEAAKDSDQGTVTPAVDTGPRAKLQLAVQKMELSMEARALCSEYLTSDGEHERARDVLHLDIVLTGSVRTVIEANLDYWLAFLKEAFSLQGSVSAGDALLLLQMCRYATANYAQLQGDNQHSVACVKELQQACELLQDTKAPSERLVTWTLQVLLANAQRLDTVITYDSSRTLEQMEATCGPLADALHVDQGAAKIAVEDAVRAMPHAPLAQVLAPVEQVLQKLLGGSVWRIVSPMQSGAAVGRLRFEQSLAAVQDLVLQEPTIIIAEQVGGDEDLPQGAVALLCMQNIDVLCHAALRARATGAFLACCLDKDILFDLNDSFSGQQVSLTMNGQDVVMHAADDAQIANHTSGDTSPGDAAQGITAPPLDCSEWVVEQGIGLEHVGSKCINLWRMYEKMSSLVPVPTALALPFSAWPRLLSLPENSGIAEALRSGKVGSEAEHLVHQVSIPDDLHRACGDALNKLSEGQAADHDAVIHAIKRVWASKYGERACRASSFLNVPLSAIQMSVVLQPLISASMAFVSHTQDPRQLQDAGMNGTGGRKYMYIEAVSGLGESLVGNVSGQPLSLRVDYATLLKNLQDAVSAGSVPAADLKCLNAESVNASNGNQHASQNLSEWLSKLPESDFENAASCLRVETAPSKPWMVVPGRCARGLQDRGGDSSPVLHYGMIARSASNMEDLQSYSGAGVFDSFPTEGSVYCVTDSCESWAGGFKAFELKMVLMALASLEVKACLNAGEMDVEGVIDAFGNVHVVQARPQV